MEKIKEDIDTDLDMLSLLETENDADLLNSISNNIKNISEELESIRLLLLLNGKYDNENCIVEIHPGAGGTESCDWALMLYRMYTRWCDKKHFSLVKTIN